MKRPLFDKPLSLGVLDVKHDNYSRAISDDRGYEAGFSFHQFKGSDFIEFKRGLLK